MPARTGQLDEISQAIGRLEGKVDALDVYTHEREHNIDNLRAMVNGLSAQMSRDVASAKGEISATLSTAIERVEARMQTIDDRVSALETIREQQRGASNIVSWTLQSPLVGWLVAAALFVAAWWKGQIR
jgi:predicted RNase H-like nuclease (RuvC/YqgF family)